MLKNRIENKKLKYKNLYNINYVITLKRVWTALKEL